jgi:hypothetical protein
MSMYPRENATHIEDLPHEFVQDWKGNPMTCSECTAGPKDPRHMAWEAAALAERERAHDESTTFARETGS